MSTVRANKVLFILSCITYIFDNDNRNGSLKPLSDADNYYYVMNKQQLQRRVINNQIIINILNNSPNIVFFFCFKITLSIRLLSTGSLGASLN